MLRLVHFVILPGMLLIACADWVGADTATNSAAATGKQMYSNRPIGFVLPSPYYGTPMTPRFAMVPGVPYSTTSITGGTRVAPQVVSPGTVRAPEVVPSVPIAPVVPAAPVVSVVPVTQVTPATPVIPTQVVEKTTYILREPKLEVNVNDELDAFHARLAKIQLEKHLLAETLALIEKIKSDTYKVRTVVDLAEYVSRDRGYRVEADQLYRLAINGMEALNNKQPFHVILPPDPVVPSTTQSVTTQPVVPSPVAPQPVAQPPALVPQVQPVPPSPEPTVSPSITPVRPVRPQPIPLEDTPSAQPNPPVARPPILLQEESSINNGKKILPPPDPPRDEKNGIVVSPPPKPLVPDKTPNDAPPALTQQSTPPVKQTPNLSPADSDVVKPKPTILLEDEPVDPNPEEAESTRKERLSPIVLEEN